MMKKAISLAFTMLLMFTAGCAKPKIIGETPPAFPMHFSATADFSVGEKAYSGVLKYAPQGGISLAFSVPERLAGVCLTANETGTRMTLGNLPSSKGAGSLPESNFTHSLLDLFKCAQTEVAVKDGEGWRISCNGGNVFLSDTGEITEITIPSLDFEGFFTQFTLSE